MTTEEKAKAYVEALERAKKLQENANGMILKKWLWEVFPELKESDDERIKKALIRFHTSTIDIDGIKGKEIIAWLEKQGEQILDNSTKSCNYAWSEEDEDMLKKAIRLLDEFGGDRNACAYTLQEMSCRDCADWLKSLKQRIVG